MTANNIRKLVPKDERQMEQDEAKAEIFRHIDEMAELFLASRSDTVTLDIPDPDDGNSRKPKNFSRRSVYLLALNMDTNQNIAKILGVDDSTVKKHFKKELDLARAVMKNKVKAVSTREALNGKNVVDRIFWLKNFGGMSDNGITEDMDEEQEAVFKVTAPAIPKFPKITKESVDEMLSVIEAGEDQ